MAPFYAYVVHYDERASNFYKRLVRDVVRFDEGRVTCAAAAVVAWLTRRGARTFASWHLRRNEFQFATAADPSVADRRGKGCRRPTSKRSSLGRLGCRFGGI